MTTPADPPKRGRKPLPEGDRMVVVPIRLTPAQRDKLKTIGTKRLRDWLDKAKP